MTFKTSLENGQKIERELAQRLIRRGVNKIEFSPKGKFKDWDLKVSYDKDGITQEKTFEVKDDIISSKTGNIGFEYRCYGKASGIYASKADYIVYHLDDKFYYQDRGELLFRLSLVNKEVRTGGDYNGAEMYIVNKKYLPNLFKELN